MFSFAPGGVGDMGFSTRSGVGDSGFFTPGEDFLTLGGAKHSVFSTKEDFLAEADPSGGDSNTHSLFIVRIASFVMS